MKKTATINADAVLDFWFGELREGWITDESRGALWFAGKRENDEQVRASFSEMINAALREGNDGNDDAVAGTVAGNGNSEEAREVLARIILLDQMTRMIFRGEARAFCGDETALALCKRGLRAGLDKTLPPVFRQFFYLPLEHSEDLDDQDLCVHLFAQLRDEHPAHSKPLGEGYNYAVKHKEIIAKFGRFPHRNAALARESTAEEKEYLRTAEHFGQGGKK